MPTYFIKKHATIWGPEFPQHGNMTLITDAVHAKPEENSSLLSERFQKIPLKNNTWWSWLKAKALSALKAFCRLTIQFPNQYFINWIEVQCSLLIKKVWLSTELKFSFGTFQARRWATVVHLALTHTHTHALTQAWSSLDCFCIYGLFYDHRASDLQRHRPSGDFPATTERNKHELFWLWP